MRTKGERPIFLSLIFLSETFSSAFANPECAAMAGMSVGCEAGLHVWIWIAVRLESLTYCTLAFRG